MKFGEILRKKRKEKGMSIRDLSELIGNSHVYIFDVEKSRRHPIHEISKLRKIAKVLEFSEEEFADWCDMVGRELDIVPPDVAEYLKTNKDVVASLRAKMREEKDEC